MDNASPSDNVAIVSIVALGDAFTINVDTKFVHFSVRMRSPYRVGFLLVSVFFLMACSIASFNDSLC